MNALHGSSIFVAKSSQGRKILPCIYSRRKEEKDWISSKLCNTCRVTDPRDKVYGVLGMASDARLMVPVADYYLPTEAVYIELLYDLTSIRKDHDWLILADQIKEGSMKPSWFPDLRKRAADVLLKCRKYMVASRYLLGYCIEKGEDSKPSLADTPA